MNIPPLEPVFGLAQELLTLVFIVIGVITFLAQQFGQAKPPVQPPVRRPGRPQPRPRDDRHQDEIDIFLQEVTQRSGQPPAEAAAERPGSPPPAPPRRRRLGDETPTSTVPSQSGSRRPRTQQEDASARRRRRNEPGARISGVELLTGGGIEPARESELERRLATGTPTYQDAHSATGATGGATRSPLSTQVRSILRDPQRVKQAILINEILALPKGRRR